MRVLGLILLLVSAFSGLQAQVCTLSGTGTVPWVNPGPACQEGGTASGKSVIVIPAGVILDFDSNGDTWTGVRIDVYGTLRISQPSGISLNSSIQVKSTGLLELDQELRLGTNTPSCSYGVGVETGGTVTIDGNASDRLVICGTNVAQGGGGCKPYPGSQLPFCAPSGGFDGPTGFDKTGYNPSLPVT